MTNLLFDDGLFNQLLETTETMHVRSQSAVVDSVQFV